MSLSNKKTGHFAFLDDGDYAMYFLEQVDPFELPNRAARDEKFKEIKETLKDLSRIFSSKMLVEEKSYKTPYFSNFNSFMEYHRAVIKLTIYSLDDLDHLRSIISNYGYDPEMTPIPISLEDDIESGLQGTFIAEFIRTHLYEPLDPTGIHLFHGRSDFLKAEKDGFLSLGAFDKIKKKYPISFWV